MIPNRPGNVFVAALLVAGSLFSALSAQAQLVVADTYGSSSAPTGGWVVSGADSSWGAQYTIGSMFRPSASGDLDSLILALGDLSSIRNSSTGFFYSSTNAYTVALKTVDSVGDLPGATLESWSISNVPGLTWSSFNMVRLDSILAPELVAGTRYYIVASGADGAAGAWAKSRDLPPADLLNFHHRAGDDPTIGNDELGAYRVLVNTNAVPEPSTYGLAGVAVLAALIWRRMRR